MRTGAGFTLIELMVGLTIMVIVISFGIPAFQNFVSSSRIGSQANDLVTAVNMARSEAVRSGTMASICAENEDWFEGWAVWPDENCNGAEPLWVREQLHGDTQLTVDPAETTINFLPRGMREGGDAITITLQASDCRDDQARQLRISVAGRASVNRATCS